jgi:hypothetical protein
VDSILPVMRMAFTPHTIVVRSNRIGFDSSPVKTSAIVARHEHTGFASQTKQRRSP